MDRQVFKAETSGKFKLFIHVGGKCDEKLNEIEPCDFLFQDTRKLDKIVSGALYTESASINTSRRQIRKVRSHFVSEKEEDLAPASLCPRTSP